MNELYWITRLDAIIGFFIALVIVSGTATIFSIIARCDDCSGMAKLKKLSFWSIPALLLGISGLIFVPTTKEALVIYGVGGTIDYVKLNPTAKQLPDKCINALDKWVDTWNKDSIN
jgi:hypothetical protein